MTRQRTVSAILLLIATLLPMTPAAAAEPMHPVFEADSDLFELVGRIKDGRMTLTLDRWANNEPVSDARIEIESNGRALVAAAQADGTYIIDAAPFAAPATYPLTITITAGDESDLLAADLMGSAGAAPSSSTMNADGRFGAILAGALALIAAVSFLVLRRRRNHGESA